MSRRTSSIHTGDSDIQSVWRSAQANGCNDRCGSTPFSSIYRIWVAAFIHSPRHCAMSSRRRRNTRKPVWVLDRPNPVGRLRRGPDAARGLAKLCRRRPRADAPWAHAWRARFLVCENARDSMWNMGVIEMQGWRPDAAPGFGWPVGERAWINPSPNAPIFGWRAPMRAR